MTTPDEWAARMRRELERRAVSRDGIEQITRDVREHLADSGEDPLTAFGSPEAYAAQAAGSLTRYVPEAPSAGPVRLRADGVGKRYGRRWVLDGVDLHLRAGQVAAVVGANGSGKSTLLQICAGLIRPDRGTVTRNGTVGFCPQHGGTFDFLSPDEHFALVGAGRSLSRADAVAEGRRLAAALQWDASEAVPARHLSGGTRQKLNLVLASLGDPDIVLLDEPYQGFDHGSYLDFWSEVWKSRDRGRAVVVVTHLLEQLDRVDVVLDLPTAGARATTRPGAARSAVASGEGARR